MIEVYKNPRPDEPIAPVLQHIILENVQKVHIDIVSMIKVIRAFI